MALQIDRSIILPKIERKVKGKRFYSSYQKETSSLADETVTLCEEWIDTKQYAGKDIDTRDDCRRSMYTYTLDNINLRDKNKSYFVPTFIWVWLAQKLVWYIIAMIIESYWLQEEPEESLFYLVK